MRRFPQLVAVEPGMEGARYGEQARQFLSTSWRGASFMAVGLRDPVLGKPVMEELRGAIKVEVFDQDWPDGDDLIVSMDWSPPFEEAKNTASMDDANYDVTVTFEK